MSPILLPLSLTVCLFHQFFLLIFLGLGQFGVKDIVA